MKAKAVILVLWLFTLTGMLWLGFQRQWSARAWIDLGLVLLVGSFGWLLSWWQRRLFRNIASLPADERERRLATMPPEHREHVFQWMKSQHA